MTSKDLATDLWYSPLLGRRHEAIRWMRHNFNWFITVFWIQWTFDGVYRISRLHSLVSSSYSGIQSLFHICLNSQGFKANTNECWSGKLVLTRARNHFHILRHTYLIVTTNFIKELHITVWKFKQSTLRYKYVKILYYNYNAVISFARFPQRSHSTPRKFLLIMLISEGCPNFDTSVKFYHNLYYWYEDTIHI